MFKQYFLSQNRGIPVTHQFNKCNPAEFKFRKQGIGTINFKSEYFTREQEGLCKMYLYFFCRILDTRLIILSCPDIV